MPHTLHNRQIHAPIKAGGYWQAVGKLCKKMKLPIFLHSLSTARSPPTNTTALSGANYQIQLIGASLLLRHPPPALGQLVETNNGWGSGQAAGGRGCCFSVSLMFL